MKPTYTIRTEEDAQRLSRGLLSLDLSRPWMVTVVPAKKKRSVAQNALYWMWLTVIRDHIRDTIGKTYGTEDLHDLFRDMFLAKKVTEFRDRTLVRPRSTTDLGVMEFSDYLNQVDAYCADRLNLILPHPDDLYNDAMASRRAA